MENNVLEQVYGKNVFNDEVMQAKLPKDVYKSWKKTLENGEDLVCCTFLLTFTAD